MPMNTRGVEMDLTRGVVMPLMDLTRDVVNGACLFNPDGRSADKF